MEMSEDNFFHIFSLLPAKMICKSKTVSKSFSALLEETSFQTKQAENSLARDDPCFFVQPDEWQRHIKRVELHALPGEQPYSGFSNNVLRFLSESARVLSSSNGLILCCTTNKDLFVCNPVTKSWLPIPMPEELERNPTVDFNAVLECYPDPSDDFLVFLFVERPIDWAQSYVCKVYRAKEDLWKTMEKDFLAGGRSMGFNMPVHHNGNLHFISDSFPYFARGSPNFKPYIMSYNLENGMSTMLRLPNKATKGSHHTTCNMGIFKWGKVSSLTRSICLVRLTKSVFTVWRLRDYGSSSWQRVLKIRVKAMGVKEKNPYITGFTVMNGDLLIFATEEKVYSYGLSDERYMMLEEIGEHRCGNRIRFTPYTDTFRPCGNAAATLPF